MLLAFEKFCWFVTAVVACFGAARVVLLAISSSASAPQYAAEAAGICALILVPYVFTRAIQGFRRADP